MEVAFLFSFKSNLFSKLAHLLVDPGFTLLNVGCNNVSDFWSVQVVPKPVGAEYDYVIVFNLVRVNLCTAWVIAVRSTLERKVKCMLLLLGLIEDLQLTTLFVLT